MPHPPHFLPPIRLSLKIKVWHKVPIVGSRLSARIGHREQRYLMAPLSHQFHELEQVDLSSAERIVIFVAIQNLHEEGFLLAGRLAGGRSRQMFADVFCD